MEGVVEKAVICTTIIAQRIAFWKQNENCRKRRKRSVWVKDWLRARNKRGAYNVLLNELKRSDFIKSCKS